MHFDASSFTDPDSKITGYEWDFDGNGTVDRTTDGPTTDFAYATRTGSSPRVSVKDFRGGAGNAEHRRDGPAARLRSRPGLPARPAAARRLRRSGRSRR